MIHKTSTGCCEKDIGMSKAHQPHHCDHGNLFLYSRPLSRASEKKPPTGRKRGMKKGRGFAASPEQQAKVRDLPCLVCVRDRHEVQIQAAHVYPRRLCPCTCAEGVVPLCAEHHALQESGEIDLMPYLDRGYRAEAVHAFIAHEIPLSFVMEKVSPRPVSEAA